MRTTGFSSSLAEIFAELVLGKEDYAFVLNRGDAGLLASLDRLSADAASESRSGGATIAAHVDHLRYGLSLMNRWVDGANPFAGADWAAAWNTTAVDAPEWDRLRRELRLEAEQWLTTLHTPREVSEVELTGMIGSVAHLAYHLGAIRQIDASSRGPREAG